MEEDEIPSSTEASHICLDCEDDEASLKKHATKEDGERVPLTSFPSYQPSFQSSSTISNSQQHILATEVEGKIFGELPASFGRSADRGSDTDLEKLLNISCFQTTTELQLQKHRVASTTQIDELSAFSDAIELYLEAETTDRVNNRNINNINNNSSSNSFLFSSIKNFKKWLSTASGESPHTKALALIEKLRIERDYLLDACQRKWLNDPEHLFQSERFMESDMLSTPLRPTEVSDTVSAMPVQHWKLFEEIHPLPSFDLDSPVISHLLASWTTDENKIHFFKAWLRCLDHELPQGFPKV